MYAQRVCPETIAPIVFVVCDRLTRTTYLYSVVCRHFTSVAYRYVVLAEIASVDIAVRERVILGTLHRLTEQTYIDERVSEHAAMVGTV